METKGNVLLIKGQSQYDAMRNYIDEMELGFRLAGYNTIILDGLEQSFVFQLDELKKAVDIDYVVTCNGIFFNMLRTKLKDAVYITYLCDHPAVHRVRLMELDDRSIVFTCDAFYEKYVKEYCSNIKHVRFIPLSGSYSGKYISYKNREKGVVFTGSYTNPKKTYKSVSDEFEGVLKTFAEYMLKDIVEHPNQTLDMCLAHVLELTDVEVSKEEFHELADSFRGVERYARQYYRDKIIRTLVENGIKVHVFGNGWERFESEYAQNLIIEKGNFYVAQKAVANAKISLNVMPWFKAGFQERIATAMLSGTVALTEESIYINENFANGEELVVYSLEHLEELPGKIKALLEDDAMAESISLAGKERAENELTWQHRTFEMISFIRECAGDESPVEIGNPGNVLQIPYENLNDRAVARDAIKSINDILEIYENLLKFDRIDLVDIKYLYTRYLFLFMRIKANFPEIVISEFVYEYLMNLSEEHIQEGAELLILECTNIQSLFLKEEYHILNAENENYKNKLANTAHKSQPDAHSQEVLVRKILKNYENSSDEEILECLANIRRNRWVTAYNQNFVKKYTSLTKEQVDAVQYDEEAGMHYVDWHGKKMYYPKGHSREYVASQVKFVNLEQDPESPHRYFEGAFCVQEGDIIIDAGVAEGNLALEAVEKAKKVYLVECKHEWVEALEKTFEPWKEKVTIIEKMLGAVDDDTHIRIDTFVEEGVVNFIKMDVEGAEIDSLKGASKILENSENIRCAICAYHRKNAERDIRAFLESKGFFTMTSKGYMFFKEDIDSWVDGELRRGLVKAVK